MRNFQDTFESGNRPFISAVSICMTVPLMFNNQIPVLNFSLDNVSKAKYNA